MREFSIWDNQSDLILGNGETYNVDFIVKQFGLNLDDEILLIKEDNKVIEITPLQVYIDMYNIETDIIDDILDIIEGELSGTKQ